jgi:hypothetical protein
MTVVMMMMTMMMMTQSGDSLDMRKQNISIHKDTIIL